MSTGAGIAVAMGVMNVAVYAFTLGAANLMGPGAYSPVAAMMSLLTVVSVGALGLQATAARRISAHPERVAQIEAEVLSLTWRVSIGIGVVLLALSPVINTVLRLDSWGLAALAGPVSVPLTLVGGYIGILQGERRWLPLGFLYMAAGIPRLALGISLLAWQPTAQVAVIAVLLGAVFPVVLGWRLSRSSRRPDSTDPTHSARAILRETLHNSQALLALFAVSSADVIVARNTLSDHDAGLYAGGVILAKMLTFLPQFVVVVAFPTMASASRRTRALTQSLTGVAALGLVCTMGVWLFSWLALYFAGGQEFAEIRSLLWLFALLGTVLALLQLVVYSVLARQGQRSSYIVWLALVLLVVGGLATDSVAGLLLWVLLVDVALLITLVAISYSIVRQPAAEQEPLGVSG